MRGNFNRVGSALAAVALALFGAPMAVQSAPPASAPATNAVQATAQETPASVANSEKSVVRVVVLLFDANGQNTGASLGTGFVVAPGRVMTNNHVIEGEGNPARRQILIVPNPAVGSQAVPGEVIRRQGEPDFALISAPTLRAPVISIAGVYPDREATIRAFGFPGITDQILSRTPEEMMAPQEPVITSGSIALFSNRAPGGSHINTIFHTAFINPGNSGGPLMDACGRVIGINTWSGSATQSEEGISVPQGQFIAIQSNAFSAFLAQGGVRITPVTDPCVPPLDPRVNATLAASQAALAEMRHDREVERADEAQRNTMTMALGVIAVIVIAGVALAVMLLRRRPSAVLNPTAPPVEGAAGTEAAAAEGAPPAELAPAPKPNAALILSAVAGAVVVLSLGAFFGINAMTPHPPPPAPEPPAPPPAAPPPMQGAYTLTCVPSSGGGAPITFSFDADTGCANDQVAYERTPTGFERVTFQDARGIISRLTLSPDLITYTRSLFHPEAADYQRLSRAAGQSPSCPAPGDQAALASTAESLRSVRTSAAQALSSPPQRVLVWRCTPTPAQAAPPPVETPPVAQPEPTPQPQPQPEPQPQPQPPQADTPTPTPTPGPDAPAKQPAGDEDEDGGE